MRGEQREGMELARIGETGKLELVPETLNRVKLFPCKTKWVVVFGVARGGKSTICNLILGSSQFTVSDKSEPCTLGLWLSHPVLVDEEKGEYLVVVDSEGTEMGNTKHQHKVLALACLLASGGGVLVHNEKHYAKTAICSIAVVATTMKLLRGLEQEQFPSLCFLVQGFEARVVVNGREASLDAFFDHFLSDTGDRFDLDRQLVRQSFQKRKMFTTPPLKKKHRDYLEQHNKLPESSYKTDFDTFLSWLLATVEPKRVGSAACDGSSLVPFLEVCVQSINENGNIEIPSVLETLLARKRVKDASAQTQETTHKTSITRSGTDTGRVVVYVDQSNAVGSQVHVTVQQKNLEHEVERCKKRIEGFINDNNESIEKTIGDVSRLVTTIFGHKGPDPQDHCDPPHSHPTSQNAQSPPPPRIPQLPPAAQAACTHDFSLFHSTPIYDYKHRGRWGGFMFGHKCCRQCVGHIDGRCRGQCNDKCLHPLVIGMKNDFFCKKCGLPATQL
eukprot:Phypoly_transcript_01365.p2 GENE.Phypoly_transcript_01365~~Phypoly_transcript_01365.p2  ORF type:complete len:502 (+),score=80.82 Phypoly_transcript_01365:144-1649(+)